MRDVFDTNLGAKESVVTAALGGLDTIDLILTATARINSGTPC